MSGANPLDYGWWLASRASGLLALVLVTGSVVIGLAMATRLVPAPARRAALAVHEQCSLVGLTAIAVHGVALLGDPWLHPGPAGIALPFTMTYRPGFTGLGIIAGYLAALLGLSFYARRRIGPRLWRRLHGLTLLAWALSVVHTLGAGSDARSPWLLGFVGASSALIAALAAARLAALAAARGRARPASTKRGRTNRARPASAVRR